MTIIYLSFKIFKKKVAKELADMKTKTPTCFSRSTPYDPRNKNNIFFFYSSAQVK